MKLKLVVASMSVLGLLSSSFAFADTTTVHKKHHYKRVHKVRHVAQTHEYKDTGTFKDTGALPVVEPRIDTYTTIYDGMSQNLGRAKAMPDWFNRIAISGGLNTDLHWGNRSMGYQGENNSRISINDVYLNGLATVNDWTKAFASISFNNASTALPSALPGSPLVTVPMPGQYSNVYTNNQVSFEQAYVTFSNYDQAPFFVQIGKQFNDFGRYTIHPIERTMTQVMSESLQTSVRAGFITRMGLHGSIYAFDSNNTLLANAHTKTVYGAGLGIDQPNEQLGYAINVGYMSDMTGVNDVAYGVGIFNGSTTTGVGGTSVHRVGAIAVAGDVNSGPFSLAARYTTSIQSFSPADLSTQYQVVTASSGARPWAADLTAGFGFNGGWWTKSQNVYVGYQASNNAVNLFLPKSRWLVGYNVDMWKNANVGLEVGHDVAYSSSNGGSGKNSNTIGARVGVKFG